MGVDGFLTLRPFFQTDSCPLTFARPPPPSWPSEYNVPPGIAAPAVPPKQADCDLRSAARSQARPWRWRVLSAAPGPIGNESGPHRRCLAQAANRRAASARSRTAPPASGDTRLAWRRRRRGRGRSAAWRSRRTPDFGLSDSAIWVRGALDSYALSDTVWGRSHGASRPLRGSAPCAKYGMDAGLHQSGADRARTDDLLHAI